LTKHLGPAILALALSGGLAACDNAGGKARRAAKPGRVTAEEAVAYASVVNLGQADLPGWASIDAASASGPGRAAVSAARCAGGVNPRRWIANSYSATFQSAAAGSLYSEVLVWPTGAVAKRNARAEASPQALACDRLQAADEHAYRASTGVLRRSLVSVSALPAAPTGASTVFARRTIWTDEYSARHQGRRGRHGVRLGPTTLRSYEDVFAFVVGPAQIQLVANSVKQPMSTTTERDALTAIYARAASHELSVNGG
jgi:hypothetical protein